MHTPHPTQHTEHTLTPLSPHSVGGLAEALKLVRRKGLIDDDVTTDFAGRANDERPG